MAKSKRKLSQPQPQATAMPDVAQTVVPEQEPQLPLPSHPESIGVTQRVAAPEEHPEIPVMDDSPVQADSAVDDAELEIPEVPTRRSSSYSRRVSFATNDVVIDQTEAVQESETLTDVPIASVGFPQVDGLASADTTSHHPQEDAQDEDVELEAQEEARPPTPPKKSPTKPDFPALALNGSSAWTPSQERIERLLRDYPDRKQSFSDSGSSSSDEEVVKPPAEEPPSLTLSVFSNAWEAIPWRHRILTVLASLGINLALPFINGVMLGFGEIFAREWISIYFGIGPHPVPGAPTRGARPNVSAIGLRAAGQARGGNVKPGVSLGQISNLLISTAIMGHTRPRYNAKARGQPRPAQEQDNSKAEIIIPLTAAEKAALAAQKEADLDKANTGKMSSKKRKRLNQYIDKKLKQERRGELLQELHGYQSNLPADLQLTSTSSLGSRRLFTAQSKLEHKERLAERKRERLKSRIKENGYHSQSDEASDADEATQMAPQQPEIPPSSNPVPSTSAPSPIPAPAPPNAASSAAPPVKAAPSLGSGLKRSADGSVPVPIVFKRRKTAWGRLPVPQEADDASDDSFDSSDSAFDDDEGSFSEEEDQGDDGEDDGEEWQGIPSDGEAAPAAHIQPSETGNDSEPSQEDEASGLSEDEEEEAPRREKGSFAKWAQEQRDKMEHHQPHQATLPMDQPAATGAPREKPPASNIGPLGEHISLPKASIALEEESKKFAVQVDRPASIQDSRMQLPILAEEDTIMHAIRHNAVTVLCGETGSGKTTQVPQFLYEAGFGHPESDNPGMIGVTQPRRVAAVSMAKRVAQELGLDESSSVVAHQIRYDSTTSPLTKIKFMTDGVLLRELSTDFLLSKYSVIIVDEAHERSINTDILLGVLSRVVKLREDLWRAKKDKVKPLRFVIMSATLQLTDFISNRHLFPKQPELVNVTARQYPVSVHFSRKTSPNYLEEAYKKTTKIHARLPPGGILVFLTGQDEIQSLCRRLNKRFSAKAVADRKQTRDRMFGSGVPNEEEEPQLKPDARNRDVEAEELDIGEVVQPDLADDVDRLDGLVHEEDAEALDSSDDDDHDPDLSTNEEDSDVPMVVRPLYSLMPSDKQMRVFDPVPEGHRLVVVSTNVAETSLTIPGIRYVVDCGRAKERHYDPKSGMQSFQVSWISKASASQRAGRAGRTGPGHCYRLYSSPVYERYLADHATPEILRIPIESMVLQMKSINIDVVSNFPFPTPPDRFALMKAEDTLTQLGALEKRNPKSKDAASSSITDLGKAMSLFPLSPRYSKMLVTGQQHGCLPYAIALVCALTVGDPFLREDAVGVAEDGASTVDADQLDMSEVGLLNNPDLRAKELQKLERRKFFQSQQKFFALGAGQSDAFKLLSAVGAYEHENGSLLFCDEHFLRPKAMSETHKLRSQITQLVQAYFPKSGTPLDLRLPVPSDLQLKVLRQLIAASFMDQVAIRKDLIDSDYSTGRLVSCRDVAYHALHIQEDVYVHSSSVLFNQAPPDVICYQELLRTNKPYLKGVTKISANWLATLSKPFCTFTKILETPGNMLPKSKDGKTREVFVVPRFGDGSFELELKPIKMQQVLEGSRWVFGA